MSKLIFTLINCPCALKFSELAVSMEVPTATQLRKLRVVDLRKRLQSLELTQSGEDGLHVECSVLQ